MASLNLAGKTSGYVKLQAPDDSSSNPTVTLPTESGELALKIWTEEDGKAVYDGDVDIQDRLFLNSSITGAGHLISAESSAGHLSITCDKNSTASDPILYLRVKDKEFISTQHRTDGQHKTKISGLVNMPELQTLGSAPNLGITEGGNVYKSTLMMYSAEEVDKKLAIKDKLIEKLEARLDELEEKLKK